jgi:hypothetical protein
MASELGRDSEEIMSIVECLEMLEGRRQQPSFSDPDRRSAGRFMVTRMAKSKRPRYGNPAKQAAANPSLVASSPASVRGIAAEPRSVIEICPACGAEMAEEGPLGCCGAVVGTCEGGVDGVGWRGIDEGDPRLGNLEHHYWYLDTGLPAPNDTSTGPACRCA